MFSNVVVKMFQAVVCIECRAVRDCTHCTALNMCNKRVHLLVKRISMLSKCKVQQ